MTTKDTIEKINTLLIDALKQGTIPWSAEWNPTNTANAVTGRGYRGINALLLPMVQKARGWKSSLWLTFNQAKAAGGNIRKGERGSSVYFWKFFKAHDAQGNEDPTKVVPWLKTYTVFNLDQTEGIDPSRVKSPEVLDFPAIENYAGGPRIIEDGSDPYYLPGTDEVHLPTSWKSETGKYQTTYHELAHSTGHKSRLERDMSGRFGSREYAREELVAEIASAYACAVTGKSWWVENTAAYLRSWLECLANDPMLVIWASSRAEKAARMMLGLADDESEAGEETQAEQKAS